MRNGKTNTNNKEKKRTDSWGEQMKTESGEKTEEVRYYKESRSNCNTWLAVMWWDYPDVWVETFFQKHDIFTKLRRFTPSPTHTTSPTVQLCIWSMETNLTHSGSCHYGNVTGQLQEPAPQVARYSSFLHTERKYDSYLAPVLVSL